jgi:hypothetical protein
MNKTYPRLLLPSSQIPEHNLPRHDHIHSSPQKYPNPHSGIQTCRKPTTHLYANITHSRLNLSLMCIQHARNDASAVGGAQVPSSAWKTQVPRADRSFGGTRTRALCAWGRKQALLAGSWLRLELRVIGVGVLVSRLLLPLGGEGTRRACQGGFRDGVGTCGDVATFSG